MLSVSIHYKVKTEALDKLVDAQLVKQLYENGEFVYELGIDPGMKTWNATVRRNIATGKEVRMGF